MTILSGDVTPDSRDPSYLIHFKDAGDAFKRFWKSDTQASKRPKTSLSLTEERRGRVESALAFIFGKTQNEVHQHVKNLDAVKFYENYVEDGFYKRIEISNDTWSLCVEPLIQALGRVAMADFTFAVVDREVVQLVLAKDIPEVIVTKLLFNPRPDVAADMSGYDFQLKHVRPTQFPTGTRRFQIAYNPHFPSDKLLQQMQFKLDAYCHDRPEFAARDVSSIYYFYYSTGVAFDRKLGHEERAPLYSTSSQNVYAVRGAGSTMPTFSNPFWRGEIRAQRGTAQQLPSEVFHEMQAEQKRQPAAKPATPTSTTTPSLPVTVFKAPAKPLPTPPGKTPILPVVLQPAITKVNGAAKEYLIHALQFALGIDYPSIKAAIPKLDPSLIYQNGEVVNGFMPACRLTNEAVKEFLIPLIEEHKPCVKTVDLTLCQPDPDALVVFLLKSKSLGLQEVIIPRMYTPKEFGGYETYFTPSPYNKCSALKVRQNPYMLAPDFQKFAMKAIKSQEVGPHAKDPRAVFLFTVTYWKLTGKGACIDKARDIEVTHEIDNLSEYFKVPGAPTPAPTEPLEAK